jgi:hypothetical protein
MSSKQGINLVLGTDNPQLIIPQNTTGYFNVYVPAVGAYNGKVTLQTSSVTPVNNSSSWAGTVNLTNPSDTPPFLCQVEVNPLNTFAPLNGTSQFQVTIRGSASGVTVVPITFTIIVQQNPGTALGGKFFQNIISNPNQPAELNLEPLVSGSSISAPLGGFTNQIKLIFHTQLQVWLAFYVGYTYFPNSSPQYLPYILVQASYDTINWQPAFRVSSFSNESTIYTAAPYDNGGIPNDTQFSVYYDNKTNLVWIIVTNAYSSTPAGNPYGIMVYPLQFIKGSKGIITISEFPTELITINGNTSAIVPSQTGQPFGFPSIVGTGNFPYTVCFACAAYDSSAQAWHVKAWYLQYPGSGAIITYDRTLPSANPVSPPILLYNSVITQNTLALSYVYDNYTVTFVPSNNLGSSWLAGINSANSQYNPLTLSPCPVPVGQLMAVGCVDHNNVPWVLVYNSAFNLITSETNLLGQNITRSSVMNVIVNYDANLNALVALFTVGGGYGLATGFRAAASNNLGTTWIVSNATIPNPVGGIVTGSLVNGVIEVGSQNDNWEVMFAGSQNNQFTLNVMSLNVNTIISGLQGSYNGALNFITLSHAENLTSRTFSLLLYPINTGGANANNQNYPSNNIQVGVAIFPSSNNAFSNVSVSVNGVVDPGRAMLGKPANPYYTFNAGTTPFSRDNPLNITVKVFFNSASVPSGTTTTGLALIEISFFDLTTGAKLNMGLGLDVLD